jgi:hypothetical protein
MARRNGWGHVYSCEGSILKLGGSYSPFSPRIQPHIPEPLDDQLLKDMGWSGSWIRCLLQKQSQDQIWLGFGVAGHVLGLLHVLKHLANHTTTPPATSLDARDFDNNRHQIKNSPTTDRSPFPVGG